MLSKQEKEFWIEFSGTNSWFMVVRFLSRNEFLSWARYFHNTIINMPVFASVIPTVLNFIGEGGGIRVNISALQFILVWLNES